MDETDEYVGNRFGGALFDIGFIIRIGEFSRGFRRAAVFLPQVQAPNSKEIMVIPERFLKTGLCNAHQLYFCSSGRPRSHATFRDILFPRPGGLDHLVDGPVALVQEPFAETDRSLVDNVRFLVRDPGSHREGG